MYFYLTQTSGCEAFPCGAVGQQWHSIKENCVWRYGLELSFITPPGRKCTWMNLSELKAVRPFFALSGSFLEKDVFVKRFTASEIAVFNGESMEPDSKWTQLQLRLEITLDLTTECFRLAKSGLSMSFHPLTQLATKKVYEYILRHRTISALCWAVNTNTPIENGVLAKGHVCSSRITQVFTLD